MTPKAPNDPAATKAPQVPGSAPEWLAPAVTEMMRASHVPGLSLAVVERDRVLLVAGFGHAELASGSPATPATAYLWFSMTKIVTATAALRLADEGRLDLDAPASQYVDYLRAPGPRQPTVRALLNHTAGLANPLPIRWAHLAGRPGPDPDVLLRRLMARRPYRHPIGESPRYSNLGYLALGQVIARAADEPFESYVASSVLQPAGMTRTGFAYQPDARAASGYVRAPRIADPVLRRILPAGIAGARHGSFLALNPFHVDGPAYGGLVGDVGDVGTFLRLHLGDGRVDGVPVLAPETARAMRGGGAGSQAAHGLGWFRRPSNPSGNYVEHFGAGAGFWNVMRIYPDRGLGIAVMANSTTRYAFEELFARLVGASW